MKDQFKAFVRAVLPPMNFRMRFILVARRMLRMVQVEEVMVQEAVVDRSVLRMV